ncbi:hypothetical protein Clacol_006728 [Clathrus columnatus]|uniref:HCP-like protein n=1 Tax=Clathrus columnatus TaxID=1419009 RepID=A0AAV5AJ32_9AGAM|nr:hypothetical protein Clacol_006728 [Clathrus columnatus]
MVGVKKLRFEIVTTLKDIVFDLTGSTIPVVMSFQPDSTQQQYQSQSHGRFIPPFTKDSQPDPNWTLDSIVDEYKWEGEDGPSVWDPKLDPSRGLANALMNLHNQSTPALHRNDTHNESIPNPRPYDDVALHMSNLRISDPPPIRSPSALGYHHPHPPTDLPPRSGSVLSNHTTMSHSQTRPRHAATLPPIHPHYETGTYPSADSSSLYSTHSSYYDNTEVANSYNPSLNDHSYQTHDYPHGPQTYYQGSQQVPYPYQGQQSYPVAQQYPYQQNNVPNRYYDPYYAAASDTLSAPPPIPSTPVAPSPIPSIHSQQSISYNSVGNLDSQSFPSDPSLGRIPSVSPSIRSSSSLLNSADTRPGLQRSGTVTSVDFGSRKKSKAVDLTAPPYTKAYVDDYRQRIKNDPDPEAHFTYAKYLIDAARKIGSDSPDQRAVKKYRDTLIAESLKVMRRLATQGNAYPEAQFFLANCYGTGTLGLQVDHERAYHLYLQAAKQNHAAASYRVAVCNDLGAGTRREPPRAFAFYRKAASLGDTAAMYKLGMILLNGSLGQQKNPREAIGWLKRAAEQADEENPHALHELALLHEKKDNTIVVHDEMYAKELFNRAAQFGYTPSQYKLGVCYEYGTVGCSVDPRRSIAWYTKAAEKGDPEAELALSGWYLTGSEGVLKQSDSEAYLWARRAANKGLSKAEYAVGYYAEVGIGVKQDVDLAKRWYMRAAVQGNKRAMNRLTELKRLGNKKSNQGRPTRAQTRDECIVM